MRRIAFKLVDFNGNILEERRLTLGATGSNSVSENGYNENQKTKK